MIKIKINEVLENQEKTVYWLAKEIGMSQWNLSKIVKNQTQQIKFEVLDKICNILDCKLEDIIEHVKNTEE
ncbi:MAG: helix-turn-helix transcriptional regulator [Vallitalea sp.]|jgi:putative transcriptional regulator|nr:helix-turn-helix transcriptional regulator [Vallitalea sp.]